MKKMIMIIACLILMIYITGCSNEEPINEDEKAVYNVTTMESELDNIDETYVAVGKFEPQKTVVLASNVGSKVAKLFVSEGDFVEKGMVLANLDNESIELDYNIQKNQLNGQVKMLSSIYDDNLEKMKASTILNEAGALSDEELRLAKLSLEQSFNDYKEAEKEKNLYENKFKNTLAETQIISPFNGYISNIAIQENEVNSGMGLITISDTSIYNIEVRVPDRYVSNIEIGSEAIIDLVGLDSVVTGTVMSVNTINYNDSNMYPVIIAVDNPYIKSGMYGEATLKVGLLSEKILIDKRAILKENGKEYLMIVVDNHAEKIQIQTGKSVYENVIIDSGLLEGQEFITDGHQYLLEGSEVLSEMKLQN